MTTTTETTTTGRELLAVAAAEEQAAVTAMAALEDTARAGADVSPSALSEAAGMATLRRLRREQVERDVAAAEAAAAAAAQEAALDQLAGEAAADPNLDHERIAGLQATAEAAVADFLAAVDGSHKVFRSLVNRATAAGLVLAEKTDERPDVLVAGSVQRSGDQVRYGAPAAVRLRGRDYRPPAPRLAEFFVRKVQDGL